MPTNLQALVRIQVLDRCFKDHLKTYKMKDLLDEINQALSEYNPSSPRVSDRTVYKDIQFMKNEDYGFGAPITHHRGRGYSYANKYFAVFNKKIAHTDLNLIKNAITSLSDVGSKSQFKGLTDAITRLEEVFHMHNDQPPRQILYFETSLNQLGQRWINSLYQATLHKQTLLIRYKPFEEEEIDYVFCPYFLKEYNNRWFLFGYCYNSDLDDIKSDIFHIALDRIQHIQPSLRAFLPEDRDITEYYFNKIIGVSLRDHKLLTIRFKVFGKRKHYVSTKPLHSSQILLSSHSAFDLFQVELIPNPEMYSLFLSFGQDIEIIEPIEVREELKHQAIALANRYSI